MPADREPDLAADWRADFRAAEERMLEASLSVTPSERLRWLEEALRFAAKMGALRYDDYDHETTTVERLTIDTAADTDFRRSHLKM